MPKNKGKGGKKRRRGKNENDVMKRELIEKDSDNQGKFLILFKTNYSICTSSENAGQWACYCILLGWQKPFVSYPR